MKEKILYFANVPTDLQLGKYLEDHGFEIYGIIDVPDLLKKSFKEQKIVTYQKTWYFRDHMKDSLTKKIDEEYLIDFEKKHGIDLWKLVYTDRNLYFFNDYHIFNHNEILRIVEQTARFFELILEEINPSYVWIHVPDYFHIELLYELCKSKGIKILTLSSARFPKRYIISETTDQIDDKESIFSVANEFNLKSFEELKTLITNSYKSIAPEELGIMLSYKTKIKGFLHYFFYVLNDDYGKFYFNFGRTRFKIFYNEISKISKRFFRRLYIDRNLEKEIDLKKQFVLFPLHVVPERSTLSAAPYFSNQIETIRHIAKSLPINYKLYVKEHPIQIVNGWRKISFYKEISKMPNVELLHPSFSNEDLLSNCSLVAAITGTTAFMAAFYQKPSLVFGNVLFSDLPSVYQVKTLEDLPLIIKSALADKVKIYDLNEFVNAVFENSFELDFYGIMAPMMKQFFYDGFTTDVYIPNDNLKKYLDSKKDLIDIWGSELIKKIEEHKKCDLK
ncbi:MAG: capsular polysaccharide export protein, LipB/KpsS family [Candidatus Nitrosopumilus sp. bin_7KS]